MKIIITVDDEDVTRFIDGLAGAYEWPQPGELPKVVVLQNEDKQGFVKRMIVEDLMRKALDFEYRNSQKRVPRPKGMRLREGD